MIAWLDLLVIGLVGLAVGSFLNVVADRLPSGLSLASPPSQCPECHTRLKPLDLIPVFSYLALRGKCRYCPSHIPFRIFVVELVTGALFVLIRARYGASYQGYAMMGYVSLFIVVFLIDLERQVIPNRVVLPGLLAALAIASFWPDVGPAKAAIGAGVGFGMLLALYLVPGAVIGEGDVKLAAVVGAATGFPVVVLTLAMAFVLGGGAAIALLLAGKENRKARIAFGPFMALSAMIALVWGNALLNWYVQHFWPF